MLCSLTSIILASPLEASASVKEISQVEAARGVIQRAIGQRHTSFQLELIDKVEGKDVFELESKDDKMIIRGSTGVAICSGFNWYLKYYCNSSIHWSGSQINIPKVLPQVNSKLRTVSPYPMRAYLNYCVFSYTMSFWDWERWEREVDWMALNGINMPLQVVGHEAVWLATFKKFGLSDKEMQEFFTGPAYFAWHWMTNIDSIGGPLPMNWIVSHAKLGKQILDRQRSLGMTPMLHGFSGRVPGALATKYPNCKIKREDKWYGMPGTYQIDPIDPLFKEIGKVFYKEQIRLFGTDHLYAADPFHEGSPPSSDPEYLVQVGKNVYGAMEAADPKSIWCMQTWSLREPIMLAAPKDRMLILDLDGARSWNKKNPQHGRDVMWGSLNNFGGRQYMTGSPTEFLKRCGQVAQQSENVVGFGFFDEGIEHNPVMTEALFECTWRTTSPDTKNWIYDYAKRRYGGDYPEGRAAWDLLLDSAYKHEHHGHDSLLRARPAVSIMASSPYKGELNFNYDNRKLAEAWQQLNVIGEKCKNAPGYRFDLVNVAEQAMNNLSIGIHHELVRAYFNGDKNTFAVASKQLLELIDDLDTLLGTHEMFLLGKWISDARKWGISEKEKDLYEYNARALVSVWESDIEGAFFDYASRSWSGMYSDFYRPRWEKFINMLKTKLDAGETNYSDQNFTRKWNRPTLNASSFYDELNTWEHKWTRMKNSFPAKPKGNLLKISKKLCEKYRPLINNSYIKAQAGAYSPETSYRQPKSTEKLPVKKVNITSGRPLKIQGDTEGDYVPKYTVDGIINVNKYWAAAKTPCSLRVDLGKIMNISGSKVWFYWGDKRYYQYIIETSSDDFVWTKVVDASKNTVPSSDKGYAHSFKAVSCRYVRITVLKNSANPASHIVEFQLNPAK